MLGFLSSVLPTIAQISPFNQAVKLGFDLLGQKLSNDIGGPAYKSQLPATTPNISTRTTNVAGPSPRGLAICPQKPVGPNNTRRFNFNHNGDTAATAAPDSVNNTSPPAMNNFGSVREREIPMSQVPEGTGMNRERNISTWRQAIDRGGLRQPRGQPPPYTYIPPEQNMHTNLDCVGRPIKGFW